MPARALSLKTKLLASAAILGCAAAAAGLGTFGSFTSTTSASADVASGTVSIALGDPRAGHLEVSVDGLVPGDALHRAVRLLNTGSQDLSSITYSAKAEQSSILDQDRKAGLQLTIDVCKGISDEEAIKAQQDPNYRCSGKVLPVFDTRPVIDSGVEMDNLDSLHAGGSDLLLITLALPEWADNSFQGASSRIDFQLDGMQRAGTDR